MNDPALTNIRRELVVVCVERAQVAIMYMVDDTECVVVGRVVRVTTDRAVVAETRQSTSPIMISSIVKISRYDGGKGESLNPEAA